MKRIVLSLIFFVLAVSLTAQGWRSRFLLPGYKNQTAAV
jgi:hypothetical protein